jgi:hypothetical protein
MMSTRDTWMFREPRSGSTNITKSLAKALDKEFLFIDDDEYCIKDDQVLWNDKPSNHFFLNTHQFFRLADLHLYNNPFIFRCVRKDRVGQYLSEFAITEIGTQFRNIEKHVLKPDIESFNEFTLKTITVPFASVLKFLKNKHAESILWNRYALEYDNYTIYYEDMTDPIDIPELNLYNLKIEDYTEKLPDYKKQVFTNYDEVESWIGSLSYALECGKI